MNKEKFLKRMNELKDHISQRDIARECGLSYNTVSSYVSGQVGTVENMLKILTAAEKVFKQKLNAMQKLAA